jgi:hypothetical protein
MPSPTADKRCEWCKQAWRPAKPKARTCSPRCRALLVESEKRAARQPSSNPMPGWEFLDDDDFVTTEELGSVMQVVPSTVAVWVRSGQLRAEQVPSRNGRGGKQWRVRVGDARALIAARGCAPVTSDVQPDGAGGPGRGPTTYGINTTVGEI